MMDRECFEPYAGDDHGLSRLNNAAVTKRIPPK
jgi:hypothetical protein